MAKQRQGVIKKPEVWQDTEPTVIGEFILPSQSAASQDLTNQINALSVRFVGPIPPPSLMAEYERVQSDLPDRITAMAEKEQEHRHNRENFSLRASAWLSFAGIASGLFVALFGFYFSVKAILAGHDVAGTTLGGVTLVTMVSVFVIGRRKNAANKKAVGASKPPRDDEEGPSAPHALSPSKSKVEQ